MPLGDTALRSVHTSLTGRSNGDQPARFRFLLPVVAAAMAGLLGASVALASTPVTNGYRDQAYGGGAFRPTGEKPQSKLWYTDGTWFAGMFLYRATPLPLKTEFRIYRLDQATHAWVDTGTLLDPRDQTHGDYLWDEGSQTLWVASASRPDPAIDDDATKVFKYTYNAATNIYTPVAGYPKTIPGTISAGAFQGGAVAVTIARDSAGTLWTAWTKNGDVLYSRSTNGGDTWSTPVKVPVQDSSVRTSDLFGDIAGVVAFGTKVGIMWSDHDALPSAADDGYYFAVIDSGLDPTVTGNWAPLETLPTLVPGPNAREVADDHLNLKVTSDGTVYMVGKTGKDTADCATNKQLPLIEAFRRTTAGAWSAHLVSTVGDCNTRPQLILDEQLGVAYVAMTSPNGGGTVYLKSAPLSGPDELVFRGAADQTIQRGTPFIRSATETAIDDPSTMKQNVTSATGIVVLANNITTPKFYLHNEMSLPAADATAPTGSATINGGAAFSTTSAVTVSVPATDAGSGVSLVRLSNSPATGGDGVLTTGTSYSYTSPISWTLPGTEGTNTVYVQWRDAAGNWSGVTTDTIVIDSTAPTGTVDINGGAAVTNTTNVNLSLAASDSGSGTASVLVSNSTDFSGATPIAYAASVPWTLSAGDGTKTVYVKFVDAIGNTNGSPISDTITLDSTGPTPGSVVIEGGAVVHSTSVTLTLAGVAGDATAARAANSADMSGATAVSTSGSVPWTLAAGSDGPRTVYVQWADTNGNWSAAASDDTILDATPPSGTVAINAGSAWTKSTAVSLTFPNTDGDTVQVRVGTDPGLAGAVYQGYTAGMTLPFTVSAGNGSKTVYAQFKDVGGQESSIVSDSIGLDATRPTAPRAPVQRLSNPVTTRINVHVAWSGGTDTGGSGLAGYVLRQRINGGAWTVVSNPTIPAANVGVLAGRTYQFQVAARDAAGNVGPFVNGRVLRAVNYSEASRAIRYSGSWPRQISTTYFGGAARYARIRSASATLTFTGNQVAWLSRRGPTSGRARVYLDGRLVTTINLYSSTTRIKQVVFTRTYTTVRTHKLKIVVVGTLGHSRVTVDGFFVLR